MVDSDAGQRNDRLQMILVQGTKLSLALAAPLCLGLIMVADPLIHSWVGTQFSASVLPTQILLPGSAGARQYSVWQSDTERLR